MKRIENELVMFVRSTGIFDDSRSTKEILAISDSSKRVIVLSWDRYCNAREKNAAIFKQNTNVEFIYYTKKVQTGIGVKNINKLFGWLIWVKKMIKRLKPTIIHFCDLDSCYFSLKYCVKKKIKYIYDIFDYYVDSHYVPSLLKRMVEKREIFAINNAYCTIICTEERKTQIEKSSPKKLIVIHNSPSLKLFKVSTESIVFDYVYCGSLGDKRLIDEILDLYPENNDLKFCFVGYGPLSKKCRELSEKYPNFVFKTSVPYSEVLKIEKMGACLSAIYEPTIRNHKLCAPNKFYESLALGKPVIVCAGTGIDNIVKKHDVGKIINYSADEFYRALRLLIADKRIGEKGKRAEELFESLYSWDYIMEPKLKKLYMEIIHGLQQ